MAPLGDYRVALDVDGRDVADVGEGQLGELRLSGLADARFSLVVERLSAVADESGRQGRFRVEARIQDDDPNIRALIAEKLRPGMQGVARLQAGERPLIEAWLGRALGPLRLWFWTWWP